MLLCVYFWLWYFDSVQSVFWRYFLLCTHHLGCLSSSCYWQTVWAAVDMRRMLPTCPSTCSVSLCGCVCDRGAQGKQNPLKKKKQNKPNSRKKMGKGEERGESGSCSFGDGGSSCRGFQAVAWSDGCGCLSITCLKFSCACNSREGVGRHQGVVAGIRTSPGHNSNSKSKWVWM